MASLLPILLCIVVGMVLGFVVRENRAALRCADRVAMYAIYGLLFVLGADLGAKEELIARLGELGFKALCLAVCCCTGSVLALMGAERLFPHAPRQVPEEGKAAHGPSPLAGTARIMGCFLAGILLSWLGLLPGWLFQGSLAEYALWLLVFAVGVGLGGELKAFGIVREMHLRILAVPLLIMVGTTLGSLVGSLILTDMTVRETLSVGAGYGYYSLSSLLIGQAGYPALASIALLANIFRELLGILTAPLVSRWCGPLAPIAVAGAPAMDTCLPAIARFSGERYAIIAVFSGVVLTLVVPFLVAFILNF